MSRKCAMCKKSMEGTHKSKIYCNDCAKIRRKEKMREFRLRHPEYNKNYNESRKLIRAQPKPKPQIPELNRICMEAAKLGLSYGEYVRKYAV